MILSLECSSIDMNFLCKFNAINRFGPLPILQDEIPGIYPVLPQGGKEARAHAVESLWSNGQVMLPSPELYPWVGELVQELLEFPSSLFDDQVDAMTQALSWLRERVLRLKTFSKSMNNTGNLSCFL